MKKYLSVLILLAGSLPIHAEILNFGVQYTIPSGFSSSTGCKGFGNGCALIPTGKRVMQCVGTETIKWPQIEVFGRIMCGVTATNADMVWNGEHWSTMAGTSPLIVSSPTVQIMTPNPLPNDTFLIGNGVFACWHEYEAVNIGAPTPGNMGLEAQVACSVE